MKYTKQTALDRVVRHFIYNRRKPGMSLGTCVYRSKSEGEGCKNPTRCAIGILMPPQMSQEFASVFGSYQFLLDARQQKVKDLFDDPKDATLGEFLRELQYAHDITANKELASFRRNLYGKLQVIASSFKLDLLPFKKA